MRGQPSPVPEIPHPTAILPSLPFAETERWFACGPPVKARQGWKLYVPLTVINACELVERLAPIVQRAGLHFKYVRDIKTLRKLNAGTFGYTQIGKCFVIYLPEVKPTFIEALKTALAPYRDQCPAVPCARPFGDDLPLYYRYGAYRNTLLQVDGAEVEDDRAHPAAVPAGIDDVLAPYTRSVSTDPAVQSFLLRYPVFEAITQQGKCGIFRGLDLTSETFKEVVLKVGYHRGQLQPDGSDGCSFLRRELNFYRLMARKGFAGTAPHLIDALDVPRKVILVLEQIPGTSLLAHKLQGQLTIEHLEDCWALIDRFHASDFYLGDAKLANFLATEDGKLWAVDFEAAGMIGEEPPAIRTFFLTNPVPTHPFIADRMHFLASVLYPYEEGRYSWSDRQIDLGAWLAREPTTDTSAWALEKLQAILGTAGS